MPAAEAEHQRQERLRERADGRFAETKRYRLVVDVEGQQHGDASAPWPLLRLEVPARADGANDSPDGIFARSAAASRIRLRMVSG